VRAFLSHASEDKSGFVEPLARELVAMGVAPWLDIHHHVRRQPPGPPGTLPGLLDHVVNHIPRHRRRQHPSET
jgi:hypothetical protein